MWAEQGNMALVREHLNFGRTLNLCNFKFKFKFMHIHFLVTSFERAARRIREESYVLRKLGTG